MANANEPTADAEMASVLVDQHQSVYELYLLSCCIHSPEFFYLYHGSLTAHKTAGRRKGEEKALVFTGELENDIYNHVASYYLMMRDFPTVQPCPWSWIESMITSDIENNNAIPSDLENSILVWNEAAKHAPAAIQSIVIAGLDHYLRQTRSKRVMLSDMNKNTTLQETLNSLENVVTLSSIHTKSRATELSAGVIGEGDSDWDKRQCVPGPLASLNYAMGGGLAARETMGFLAPEGAGKTVFATQFGAHYAQIRQNTLLFTTEQGVDELLPRIVANVLNKDFGLVKNGVTRGMLTQAEWTVIDNISAHLKIVDWTTGTADIATQFDAEIEKIGNEGFEPSIVIFDWLGGATGELTKYDADRMRFIFQLAANTIVDTAKKRWLRCIFMAQAAMGMCANKSKINAAMAAENKGMFQKCAWGLGLSCIEQQPGADQTGYTTDQTYAEQQWLNPFKARKSFGGMFPVRRNYKYQRLEDVNTRNKIDSNALKYTGK